MEEDIKILENCWVMKTDHVLDDENKKVKKAIENLLARNKELEEYKRIAELTQIACCTAQNCEALNNAIRLGIENEELEKMVDLILEHLSVWAMCTDDEGCFCTVKGKECNVMANECEGKEHITCKECLIEYLKKKVRNNNGQ